MTRHAALLTTSVKGGLSAIQRDGWKKSGRRSVSSWRNRKKNVTKNKDHETVRRDAAMRDASGHKRKTLTTHGPKLNHDPPRPVTIKRHLRHHHHNIYYEGWAARFLGKQTNKLTS